MSEEKRNKCVVTVRHSCDGFRMEDCKYYVGKWNHTGECEWYCNSYCGCPAARRESFNKMLKGMES